MGHLLHGSSLAFCSQVDRYGLRTMRGRIGGCRVEASEDTIRDIVDATSAVNEVVLIVGLDSSFPVSRRYKGYAGNCEQNGQREVCMNKERDVYRWKSSTTSIAHS